MKSGLQDLHESEDTNTVGSTEDWDEVVEERRWP